MAAPQVSDIPQSSPTGIPIAWKNSSTSTGVGAAPTLTATASSSPSVRAQVREHRLVGGAPRPWRAPRAPPRPPARARTFCDRRLRAPCWAGSRCSSGRLASIVSSPALSFSQMRGTAKNQVGRTCGRKLDDLARVGADRDLDALDDRQVVVGAALGDVGRRQPRDHLARPRSGKAIMSSTAGDEADQVAMGELRRPSAGRSCRRCRSGSAGRRARRRRRRGVGSKSGSIASSVLERRRRRRRRRATITCSSVRQVLAAPSSKTSRKRLLDDRDLGAGVAERRRRSARARRSGRSRTGRRRA